MSADGKTALPLMVSSQSQAEGAQVSYYVAPSGDVYTVLSSAGQATMTRRSSAGEMVSRITLPLPRYFLLQSFAVLNDKSAQFLGIAPLSETSVNPSYQSQALWIDPAGSVIHVAKNGMDVPDAQSDHAVVTTDGNSRFIEYMDGKLIVFTEKGEISAKYAVRLPSSDYFVTGIQYLGGKVALKVSQVVDESNQPMKSRSGKRFGPLKQSWLLVDMSDGAVGGLYAMPPTFVGSAECYLAGGHFLYSYVESGQRQLVEVAR